MPAKCDGCGVETNLDATFFKARKSFSRLVKTYCPTCWGKRQHSTVKWVFLKSLGLGALGLFLWFALPELGVGRFLTNLFLFQLFLMLTILPHELGHAGMARLLGMRVFKIYVGAGRTLFTVRLLGFECEFRSVPMGGLAVATHRSIERLRLKQFAFVLAGPAVNLLLAAAIWPLLDADQLWSLRPMEEGWQPALVFFYANLVVLLENLWPHNVATAFGPLPSDGKQLFLACFLSREKRELYHAMNFMMEGSASYHKGDFESARRWVEEGLALYPNDETLLNLQGLIALDHGKYGKARECFLHLLHRDNAQPLMRPILLNNIAYTNALMGGDDLLKEADALSLGKR